MCVGVCVFVSVCVSVCQCVCQILVNFVYFDTSQLFVRFQNKYTETETGRVRE